jgi:hypothetical protein
MVMDVFDRGVIRQSLLQQFDILFGSAHKLLPGIGHHPTYCAGSIVIFIRSFSVIFGVHHSKPVTPTRS